MINITISNLCDVLNTRTMNHPIWAKNGPISDSLHRGTPFQFQFQWIPLLIRTLKGYTNVSMLCASLACSQPKDDRNGNENVKRAIDLDQQNNNSARTAGFFVQPRPQGAFPWLWGRPAPKAREKRPGDEVVLRTFICRHCMTTTVKFPHRTFYGGRKLTTTNFSFSF